MIFFRYCGSISTGLILSPERTALLLEGSCPEFYHLKNEVKRHITLAGGQLRYEALEVSIV